MQTIQQPFSNLQLELLKLYADNVSETDLVAVQQLLAHYFAEKAITEADAIWEAKGYTATALLKNQS